MKTALIVAEGVQQIMLMAENDDELAALKLLAPIGEITVERKWGSLYDHTPTSVAGWMVQQSRGDYLRAYESKNALMLVIRPKAKDKRDSDGTTLDSGSNVGGGHESD